MHNIPVLSLILLLACLNAKGDKAVIIPHVLKLTNPTVRHTSNALSNQGYPSSIFLCVDLGCYVR